MEGLRATLVTGLRLENVDDRTGEHPYPLEVIRFHDPLQGSTREANGEGHMSPRYPKKGSRALDPIPAVGPLHAPGP